MKVFLVAVAISFALVAAYSIFALIVGSILGSPMTMEPRLAAPLWLPPTIYSNVVPTSLQIATASSPTGAMIERLIFFAANVLIYAVPIFGIIKLFRRPKSQA